MKANSSWLISTNGIDGKVFIIVNSSSFPLSVNRLSMLNALCLLNRVREHREYVWKLATCMYRKIWHGSTSANDYLVLSCWVSDCCCLIMCLRILLQATKRGHEGHCSQLKAETGIKRLKCHREEIRTCVFRVGIQEQTTTWGQPLRLVWYGCQDQKRRSTQYMLAECHLNANWILDFDALIWTLFSQWS